MSNVVLKQNLLNNMSQNMLCADHVIVSKSTNDNEFIPWTNIDREVPSENTSKIPSSKIVHNLKRTVNSLSTNYNQLDDNVKKLQTSATTLSSEFSDIAGNSNSTLFQLSTNLNMLSSYLSGLFNHKAVRFIGVSETDPASGIITINGIKYVISTDFDESNNGDIVYYRTTVTNHVITSIPQGDSAINYRQRDQHENVEYIRMLYAYIYANGVFDSCNSIQLTDDTIAENTQISGAFQKFGYGFYENLSTLIHDWDVCDDAKIQKHKILGLNSDLTELYARDNYISGVVDSITSDISDAVKINKNSIDDIKRDYATKKYVCDKDAELSDAISSNYASNSIVTELRTEFTSADNEVINLLSNTISTTSSILSNQLKTYISTNYIANNRVLIGHNEYAGISNANTHPIDISYAQFLLDARVLKSDIQTTFSYLDNTDKVPSMKLLKELSARILAAVNASVTEPDLGTLKFVVLSSTPSNNNQNLIDDSAFNGWVYPNGDTLTCNSTDFTLLKPFLGADRYATSFTLPLLSNFIEMWPTRANQDVNPNMLQSYQVTMPIHSHSLNNVSISTSGSILGTATIPTGKDAGNGNVAHHGKGTTSGPINADINVSLDLNNISITGSTDTRGNSGEPKPYHRRIPVMMYIGKK